MNKILFGAEIKINSADFYVKLVEMLQQNWALVETTSTGEWKVYFIGDDSGVFDTMMFNSEYEAKLGLGANGFRKWSKVKWRYDFLSPPNPPFFEGVHPNGPIYSSGRFWK